MIDKSESTYWVNVWWILAADNLTFEEVMSDFRKKHPVDWFRGGKACKDIPGKNNILPRKKSSLMTCIMLKKSYTVICQGKNFQLERFGKKILAHTKSPIPPLPQKSNGQPHRGWERSRRIWHLSRCHVVVFKTKVLHFKIENTPIKDTSGKRKFKRVLRFIFVDKRELFAMKLSFEEFKLISFLKAFRCSFSEAIPIDRFHCHATKKLNWKPSSGRNQENEMLPKTNI